MGIRSNNKTNKLALRQSIKPAEQGIGQVTEAAGMHIDRHLIRRWDKAVAVKRQVTVWLLVMAVVLGGLFIQNRQLAAFYRKPVSVPGGTYSEGVVGYLTNMNPVFATGPVDSTASKLIFAGLLKMDENNKVTGDLADSYSVDEKGLTYTIKLKSGLKWHDGESLTADDVKFTFDTIQHPDSRSPLNQSWQSVSITVKDEQTIVFQIPVPLASFTQSLTTGIIPKHLLEDINPSQLRSHSFSSKDPIGSGPYKIKNVTTLSLESKEIHLEPFEDYHFGRPKIEQIVLRTYPDQDSLLSGLKLGVVQGASGVTFINSPDFDRSSIKAMNIPQANGVFAFFRTSVPSLSDQKVRQALVSGTNRQEIVTDHLNNTRLPLDGPLLKHQLNYSKDMEQMEFNVEAANKLLEEAGWRIGANGIREKDGAKLEFSIITQNRDEYKNVTSALQKQWEKIGVKAKVDMVSDNDIQQNHIVPHNYDILVYGISLGFDPDVYAYWHSKEAGLGGFNLSEYKSSASDAGLEAGRTRTDPVIRGLKYSSFLQAWRNDAPAVALYQPTFDYAQTTQLDGFTPKTMISPTDRFDNIHQWMIKQEVTDQ